MWFFFHIRDDDGIVPDTEGLECKDKETAKAECEKSARELLATEMRAGREIDHRLIEVTDTEGRIIALCPLRNFMH